MDKMIPRCSYYRSVVLRPDSERISVLDLERDISPTLPFIWSGEDSVSGPLNINIGAGGRQRSQWWTACEQDENMTLCAGSA